MTETKRELKVGDKVVVEIRSKLSPTLHKYAETLIERETPTLYVANKGKKFYKLGGWQHGGNDRLIVDPSEDDWRKVEDGKKTDLLCKMHGHAPYYCLPPWHKLTLAQLQSIAAMLDAAEQPAVK